MTTQKEFERCPDDCLAQILDDQIERVDTLQEELHDCFDDKREEKLREDLIKTISDARQAMRNIERYLRIYNIKLNSVEKELTDNVSDYWI